MSEKQQNHVATDFYAFNEWLWSCDSHLAVRVQSLHDMWRKKLALHHQKHIESEYEFTVDDRYRVHLSPSGLKLISLMDADDAPLAVYQTPGELFADLLAHSIKRANQTNMDAFFTDAHRLIEACQQAWVKFSEQ
ncbi:hypothetical protein GBN32_00355 [Plesiomonas shigelloides]|uniref:hypothetical protein n=1 Tax=Plesiomonas shigelloides TaxID=703 RepID=UPI0012624906|nr:hypothetical protein [Plesiomonas shigelloides]KAB7715724.1 hypothetical protein GBN32_00355 [Plesiomonas shigelloides]